MTAPRPSADQDFAIANDLAPYPDKSGITKAIVTIFGMGMLFSPITLFFHEHTDRSGTQQDTVCEYAAEQFGPDVPLPHVCTRP